MTKPSYWVIVCPDRSETKRFKEARCLERARWFFLQVLGAEGATVCPRLCPTGGLHIRGPEHDAQRLIWQTETGDMLLETDAENSTQLLIRQELNKELPGPDGL